MSHALRALFVSVLVLAGIPSAASAATTGSIAAGILNVTGDAVGDSVALRLTAPGGSTLGLDVGNNGTFEQTFPLADFTAINVAAGDGNDVTTIDDVNGAFTTTKPTTINAGVGNDFSVGGAGGETFVGGVGDDVALEGGGDDAATWNPGDGNDILEGQAGADRLAFNGNAVSEIFEVSPNGGRIRLTRSIGSIVMDLNDIERIDLAAGGGIDTVIDDPGLGATDLTLMTADLGAGADAYTGDVEQDVVAGGTESDIIRGGGGDDTETGGDGDDQLFGDAGVDTLDGNAGADTIRCGGDGDKVTFDSLDLVAGDCFPFTTVPVPSSPPPAPTTTTVTNTVTVAGPTVTVPGAPTASPPPAIATIPPELLGFAKPKVKVAGKTLKVSVTNTSAAPIQVTATATARVGRKKVTFRSAKVTIAPGSTEVITLRPTKKLNGRPRSPAVTVTNVATGGKQTV